MSLLILPQKKEEEVNYFMMDRDELRKTIDEDPSFPTAFNYRILLALPILETKTKGGIEFTSETLESGLTGNIIGRVLRIGSTVGGSSGTYGDCSDLKVGDYVTYNPHVGKPYSYKGSNFIFVSDQNIDGQVFDPKYHTDGIFKRYEIRGLSK